MTLVILLILMIIIGVCQNDYSLINGLGKIILYGAIIIGMMCIGAIIIDIPVLSIFFIIGVFIFLIYKLVHKNNDSIKSSNSSANSNVVKTVENGIVASDISKRETILSDFQKELQENTKTPQQVEDENWIKEKELITIIAKRDFEDIKRKLLNKAKNGQYLTVNGHKTISIEYYCSYLMQCVNTQHFYNPTGKMGTSSYRTNKKVTYSIDKTKQYNLYLDIIKEFAAKDNINITSFFVERDPVVYQKENKINLPYTYSHEWRTTTHEIKAYLKCSIEY